MDLTFHQPDEMAGYLGFLMHRRRAESNTALLQHFGFKEDPFGISPDPRYMFPSQTHLDALASLESGFYNNRGFIAMIAPPGMGKTTLLYKFLEDTQATARSVFLFDIDAECKPRDFVGYILRDFGVTPARSSSEMHKQLGETLVKETQAGRKCVVVIDEAQNLSDAVLERVRLITNFETSQGKLLQIIFSGQPQLTDKLMQASLVQLRQRISTFCRLDLLSPEETIAYIDYRLKQAGYNGDPLFTNDALELITDTSSGTPRTINNLCYNTLALCSSAKSKQVDREMVTKVAANLQLEPKPRRPITVVSNDSTAVPSMPAWLSQVQQKLMPWWKAATSEVKVWVPATAGVLILAVLGVLRLTGVGSSQPPDASEQRIVTPTASTTPAPTTVAPKPRRPLANRPAYTARPFDASGIRNSAQPQPNTQAAVASAPARPGVHPSSVQASLTISGVPAGADIEIDGAFVGNTPSTVSVVPGTHRITVMKNGFTSWGKTLTVTGGTIHLDAELEPAPAKY
jgi:general secretion pathway protein A